MNKSNFRIILASQSAARRELMKELGVPFECVVSDYPEDMNAYENPSELAKFLALEKAKFVAAQFPNSLIIGADTFVTNGKEKIGKPISLEHAKEIVASMSGKTIGVHSGIAIVRTNEYGEIVEEKTDYALTNLKIKVMSEEEINSLVSQKDALKISGSFSIEGEGGKMVEKIGGDYNNVIGLPIYLLEPMLRGFGVEVRGWEIKGLGISGV